MKKPIGVEPIGTRILFHQNPVQLFSNVKFVKNFKRHLLLKNLTVFKKAVNLLKSLIKKLESILKNAQISIANKFAFEINSCVNLDTRHEKNFIYFLIKFL